MNTGNIAEGGLIAWIDGFDCENIFEYLIVFSLHIGERLLY